MRNLQKGFIAPLLLALIALLILGGGAYVYLQKKQENPPTMGNVALPQATSTTSTGNQSAQTTQTPNSQTVDWKILNNKNGYSISYPSDAKIYKTDLSCVRINTKEFGSVYINAGASHPCGEPTGLGTGMIRASDNIIIAGRHYSTNGSRQSDNSYSFLSFLTPNDKFFITYGVDHGLDENNTWKNLGALTDVEYKTALESAKEIVATLKVN